MFEVDFQVSFTYLIHTKFVIIKRDLVNLTLLVRSKFLPLSVFQIQSFQSFVLLLLRWIFINQQL